MQISFDQTVRHARLLLVGLALAAGACKHDPVVLTNSVPTDYRNRHPILIAERKHSIDLLIGTGRGGLTAAQRAQVAAFGSAWRREGNGYLQVKVPKGTRNETAANATVREVTSILRSVGVPPKAVAVQGYRPQPIFDVAPIRLAFPVMRAEVANCGQWPDDLGPTVDPKYWANEPYTNFGCATQRNLAAVVTDPADLLQPRAETPPSAARRHTVIDKYRQGVDTATTVTTQTSAKVSTVGQQ
jgi:pilus assembly protein CpaD